MTIPTPAADGYITDPRTYRNRLRRLEGQLRGITRMIEQERPCIDTLTQISASKRALEGVALSLLDDHLEAPRVSWRPVQLAPAVAVTSSRA